VACIYDNWQSIFEDLPDALNAQCRNGRSPANSNQEPHYSSEAAGWAAANKLRSAEWSTLTFKRNPDAESRYYNVLCAEGNFRRSKPVLAAWLADCPEYSDLHDLQRHVCLWCECPKNELGVYVPPDKQHPRWDYNVYRMLSNANTNQQMPNSRCTMFTEDSTCFDLFAV